MRSQRSMAFMLLAMVSAASASAQITPQGVAITFSSCNDFLVSWTRDPEIPQE